MGALFCLLAVGLVLWAGRRSLGDAVGALLTVGYFYGIVRANFEDGFSHFIFDSALLATYWVAWKRRSEFRGNLGVRDAAAWVKLLVAWAVATLALSAFSDPQHPFIQLVGLRAATLVLPMLVVGAGLGREGLDRMTSWIVWLNLVALGFAAAEMAVGIERFFPQNASTEIMYRSDDVEGGHHRIPATFLNAHSYGGVMVATLPFLLTWVLARRGRLRALGSLAMFAAILGAFICAARQPVVQLGLSVGIAFLVSRPTAKSIGAILVAGLAVGLIVAETPRLQRFATLNDPEKVNTRFHGSVNSNVAELLVDYPLGLGLGSAAGTSIPYFLTEYAKPQIPLENEYARISIEQGLIGLGVWALFVISVLRRFPRASKHDDEAFPARLRWAILATVFATGLIGTGMLTSVPGSALVLMTAGTVFAPRLARASSNQLLTTAPSIGSLASSRVHKPVT